MYISDSHAFQVCIVHLQKVLVFLKLIGADIFRFIAGFRRYAGRFLARMTRLLSLVNKGLCWFASCILSCFGVLREATAALVWTVFHD